MNDHTLSNYFIKSVGLSTDPLPVRWWEERPEIVDGMYFSREPKPIGVGATLIYYAVGGDGRLCGVAQVVGAPTRDFPAPAGWTPEMRAKFRWRLPVRLISKCAADKSAPRLADFHDKRIGQGPYQSVNAEEAEQMIDAIVQRGQ